MFPASDGAGNKMPENCYFEAHIGCIITPEEKYKLEEIAQLNKAHLSRNYFKKLEDGKFVSMITFRNYENIYSVFEHQLNDLKAALELEDIHFEKVITEFAVYDTKVSHDLKWLDKQ